jgi:hypothetical protein
MSEDKKLAEKMAIEDFRNTVSFGRELGIPQEVFSYERGIPKDLPPGDGEGMMIPFIIGMRGRLSKGEARKGAAMWRDAIVRYPKAIFYLTMLGYDQDPREIWEIVDAARYVRWFAKYSELNDMETALRWFGPGSATMEAATVPGAGPGLKVVAGTLGFLAGCGVFGEEFKRQALSAVKPTPRQ